MQFRNVMESSYEKVAEIVGSLLLTETSYYSFEAKLYVDDSVLASHN